MPATNMQAVWWATRGERVLPPGPGSWPNVAAEHASETILGEACPYDDRNSRRCSARVARSIHLGDAGHMLRRLIQLVVGLVFLLGVFVGVVLGGMRSKSPPVLNAIRRFNRSVSNPRQMATAGSPGAYASVIRHVGRTSGREYETPIGAMETEDGFVVALPYGASADWLKNLLASGSAMIVNEGSTYRVDQPEVVTMAEAIDDFPPKERRMLRVFGVDKSLRVRRSELQDT